MEKLFEKKKKKKKVLSLPGRPDAAVVGQLLFKCLEDIL